MNEETVKISKLIRKPAEERSRMEIDEILPYLSKRSELLYNLERGRTMNLVISSLHIGRTILCAIQRL